MAQTVVGIFDSSAEAQRAVEQLTSRGFSSSNIDVANNTTNRSASSTGTGDEHESGIGRFFRTLFSDDDSDKYTTVANRSQSIVTVHAQSSDEAEMAADILDEYGAVDVDEKAASYGYSRSDSGSGTLGMSGTSGMSDATGSSNPGSASYMNSMDPVNPDYASTTGVTGVSGLSGSTGLVDDSNTNSKIPIIEENLEVGKREVNTGGVRLRSRIIERPVEESIRLREETVRVERNPVDRIATSADLSNFNDLEIEMRETAEVPVVSKEARVVEEISLDKEVNERTETISDTVRKTEVDVENLKSTKSNDIID